eukprot:16435382-Heterocapsa_arctica.AAC.1
MLCALLPDDLRFEPTLPEEFHLELAQLALELDLVQKADRNSRAKQLTSWAKTSLEGSAGKPISFLGSQLRPSVDTSEEGISSASPKTLLDGQTKLWGNLWRNGNHDRTGAFEWPVFVKVPMLILLTVGQLRKTSQLFSIKTAKAPDDSRDHRHLACSSLAANSGYARKAFRRT